MRSSIDCLISHWDSLSLCLYLSAFTQDPSCPSGAPCWTSPICLSLPAASLELPAKPSSLRLMQLNTKEVDVQAAIEVLPTFPAPVFEILPGAKERFLHPTACLQFQHLLDQRLLFPRDGASLSPNIIAGGKRSLLLSEEK